jgi:hypothetical protein
VPEAAPAYFGTVFSWHTKHHGAFAVVLPQSRAHRLHFSTAPTGELNLPPMIPCRFK